ncbi:MAG: helix-turn-helix domain-containing protein [Clostridiales bacterium]|nr:helix-turn-helix domain-containing protein [Clostridiales bacterium]
MNDKLKDRHMDDLCDAILTLRSREECYALFEDLCTIAEMKSLAQRFQVAILLEKGHTYTEIFEETGVSTATISRVKRCLDYGADGYKTVLDRMNLQDGNEEIGKTEGKETK